ncbi:hypothetical protein [Achromobacter phage ewik_TL4]|nr:hypothetical protein [Achromobacter phage hasilly_LB3]WNO48770.1 hypothetical protein [Achromobacter phage nyaak_TL1]WNO48898.1 hypothetical protein [Achromobacter phage kuwaak_TL2]WNO48963.1 hypothetical protein [Achromobacter phage ewii_LB8]WNO49255.1 hypothetical protein [Achromobacter phage ewik_TL4]WOZ53386.1 hypothetical protein [Achromobacter phage tuull]
MWSRLTLWRNGLTHNSYSSYLFEKAVNLVAQVAVFITVAI